MSKTKEAYTIEQARRSQESMEYLDYLYQREQGQDAQTGSTLLDLTNRES